MKKIVRTYSQHFRRGLDSAVLLVELVPFMASETTQMRECISG